MALQKQDWIDAGWLLMATKGLSAVKVEALARELKVSKGSFYWHFKNRRELLEAILQRWESETMWLIQESQTEATPKQKLLKLFTLVEELCQQPDPEPAIFMWASQDATVRERVRSLENKRVGYLAELLQDYGLNQREARHKAEVAYFALMGFADRAGRDNKFDLQMKDFNQFLLSLLLSPLTIVEELKEMKH